MPSESRIYLSPPHMDGEERALLLEAFDSNWIAPLGPHVDAFETELANFVGTRHAAALSSGTAGLHLALTILGVGAGDTVACSDFTFAATANPIRYVGAEPVFIDAENRSWNLDPKLLAGELAVQAKAGALPKAVIVAHIYGQCADMEPILKVCGEHGVPVIEDAAEALGATYGGHSAGTLGTCGVYSFNGNKIITTSGGGALVSSDESFVAAARHLSTQARDEAPHYEHTEIGFNYRMSNLLAAIGRGQLNGLAAKVDRRRAVAERYAAHFADIGGVSLMPAPEYGRSSRWLTVVAIDSETHQDGVRRVRRALEAANIEARPVWKPMHMQPVFAACRFVGSGVSETLFAEGLCLPSGSGLTDEQVDRIAELVCETLRA